MHASFYYSHLVSDAGLVPVVALAERAGLGALVVEHVGPGGAVRRAHASGSFLANAACMTCATIAHDLLRGRVPG
jgi:hypothetical protein